jgi:acetyl esterase/lipase
MPSAEAEAVKTFFRQLAEAVVPAGRTPTLEEQREGAAAMVEMGSVPEGVTVREAYAGGCRAYWHEPVGASKDRVILYLHGGGYVIGSPKSHERLVGHLARAAGCRALNLDYRLAPEHPHPAAV